MSFFKLKPSCKDYLWGGNRLVQEYNKSCDMDVLAETWELSCHKDGQSVLRYNGKDINLKDYIELKGKDILGTNCSRFEDFPILIKFIDAKENLSIQVHPNNEYAQKFEHQYGKTEMWYVMDAKEGAFLYYGFEHEISKDEFEKRIADGTLTDVLHKKYVKKGDVLFIESGTIHAIGAGVLIAEIQQNSNVTYRVFDYNRVGTDGKPRQLHVKQAIDVTLREKAKNYDFKDCLAKCDYFKVNYFSVQNKQEFIADASSFVNILVLEGNGSICNQEHSLSFIKGDSIFVEANTGKFELEGKCEILITTIPDSNNKNLRLGIDIGGTDCKIGIVDEYNNLIAKTSMPTLAKNGADDVINRLIINIKDFIKKNKFNLSDFKGIGLGVPGLLDTKTGTVLYSNNINWVNVELKKQLEQALGLDIFIANDADVAALAETIKGAAKGAKSAVMLTLGTGVGFGFINNNKVYQGSNVGTCEFGHTVIVANGKQCTCGRKGCLEAYASASALIAEARAKTNMELSGKQIFELADEGNKDLQEVIDSYLYYLSVGIVNVINAFNPQIIILGGGVCAQGDRLISVLNANVTKYCFGASYKQLPKIVIASLGNDAGMIGAANLIN